MPKPITKLIDLNGGREAWTRYDATAGVYEIFASEAGDDYIGCADTIPEAKEVAREWASEQEC